MRGLNGMRIISLGLVLCLSHSAFGMDKAKLVELYRNAKSLEVVMTQSKKAEYLMQPLKSRVRFVKTGKAITWESLKPVPFLLRVSEGGEISGDGLGPHFRLDSGTKKKVGGMVQFLNQIFSADFKAFEKQYLLEFDGYVIKAKPKSNLAPFPYSLTMKFNKKLHLTHMIMENDKETLSFVVESFDLKG